MGAKRTRLHGESDYWKMFSVPPGFESVTSFTLQKVENNEEAYNSVAVGNESEQGPSQLASTSTIISKGKLKSSVGRRPWILDDNVDHMKEDSEYEADKEDWVLCRVFFKATKGENINSTNNESSTSITSLNMDNHVATMPKLLPYGGGGYRPSTTSNFSSNSIHQSQISIKLNCHKR